MTILRDSAKRQNLAISFNVYINSQLGALFAAADQAILYPGTARGGKDGYKEWLEVYLLGPARPEPGGIGRYGLYDYPNDWLQTTVPILQVNIFSRPSRQTVAHRLTQLRDLVVTVLYPGATIPVSDYAGGTGLIGALTVRRITMDQEITLGGEQTDEEQWSYQVEAQWTERVRLVS